MTIASTTRKAGPLLGNGVQSTWPFAFKVFAATDVKVTIADANGVETVLTSNYSVALNANQETSPGGTVTYPTSGAKLPAGSVLSITGDVDYDQSYDIPSGGNFAPVALENQLDRATMQIQQLREELDRAARLPVTSSADAESLVADIVRIADSADSLDTVAGAISNVNAAAGNAANINTVAASIGAVTATAANIAAVVAVGNDLLEPTSEINTVAVSIANVNTVGDAIADVNAVAGIAANVTTVAGIAADVAAVADNVADITNFADVYQGPHATDPTLRNDGSALQSGDLYFNTTENALRAYSGAVWVAGAAGSVSVQTFSGDGVETEFPLTTAPGSENNAQIYIDGVYQQKSQFSIVGSLLTFSVAPPVGTDNVEVVTVSSLALGETDAALVSYTPAGAGAVATDVQAKLRESVSAKDFGATGSGSDETAKVQLAINSLGANGGTVTVPRGVKFNLKTLAFPIRSNLDYWMDDDLSRPNPTTTLGTNERVLFAANANGGGIVNEWRHTASFHPGVMVDVRKDVPGHDAFLGGGQSRTNPARASYNIMDEQVDAFRILYESFGAAYSNFSMTSLQGWQRTVNINGIGTAQWASVPPTETLVTGQTSGAKGFVLAVSAGATLLLWHSGKFVAGEKLIDNNETTTATISSVSFGLLAFPPLAQGHRRGNWAIGLPADAVRDQFAVGGKIASTKTRGTTFAAVDEVIDHPGFVVVDSYENGTVSGFEIIYDTTAVASARRLTVRKYNESTDRAHVNAVSAHATVGDSGSAAVLKNGAFNVASVVRNGGAVGRYDVTFSASMATANYRVLTGSQFNGHITWDIKGVNGFSFFIANAAGTAQWAPFDFDFTVIGGDI